MSTEADYTEIMSRIARGDEAALGSLYDRFGGALYSFARQVTGNDRDAEEIIQDVFLAVWDSAPKYDVSQASPFTWMMTITRNKAYDRVRRTSRRPPAFNPLQATSPDTKDLSADPAENACLVERANGVRERIAELPEDQRNTIFLAFFEGMTHREISEKTELPLGTVKSRIRLGLEALKRHINPASMP